MIKFKKNIIMMVGILLLLTLLNVQPTEAQTIQSTGSLKTSDANCVDTNKNSYAVGEEIWLHGSSLAANTQYDWVIREPGTNGTIVKSGSVTSTGTGTFCTYAHTFMPGDTIRNGSYQTKLTLDGSNVSGDNFSVSGSIVPSSFGYQIGAFAGSVQGGSVRVVTLTLTGVSVTITKTGGGTYGPYTTSQNINLPAGDYTYTYTVLPGYTGSGDSGSFTVQPCPAASVSVVDQFCEWDDQELTSSTDVILTINNATLNITGPNAYQQSFTSSQTITLPPGSYNYSWTANQGYSGSGSGSFILVECEPKVGSADVEIGACEWDVASGSLINVSITLENASLTINGQTYTTSTDIKLPPGTYGYSWVGTGDATESGSGSITVYGCEPASVTVNVDVCEWVNEVSMNDVILTISGATMTIFKDSVQVGTYDSSQTISLPAGDYTYTWTANTNYTGSGSGSFTLIECEPGKGDATVNVGACEWDATNGSMVNVIITLESAALTIDGQTYTESTEIKLSPGTYAYSWIATGDNEGSGDGEITIYGCEPASVSVDLAGCEWDGSKSVTDVTLTISGATLTIFQAGVEVGTYTTSQTISLPEGEYTYTWEAINENFTGTGSGSFTLVNCEPGVASASVGMGACVFENDLSLTPVTITLNFAVLTINGETYTEAAIIQLEPGEYDYTWVASDEEHVGEGSGTLVVGDCAPKDEETPDPVPDVAAGGQGPTLFSIFTPVIAAFAGLMIAWSVLKNKVMKNR